MQKVGRPTDYTQELADEIIETISSSHRGIITLCRINEHWPAETNFYKWIARNEEFRQRYMRAKEAQSDVLMDQIIDIADDSARDTITKTNKNGDEYEVCNSEWVNRSRLRVEARMKVAAVLAPVKYSEKYKAALASKPKEDDKPKITAVIDDGS